MNNYKTIHQELSTSEAVKFGVGWFVERLLPFVYGGMTDDKRSKFERSLLHFLAMQLVGIGNVTGTQISFTNDQTVQLSFRGGPCAVTSSAACYERIKFTDESEDLLLVVDMKPHVVQANHNRVKGQIWPVEETAPSL
ncbi:MAG TPA: hypothetical protein V6D17_00180 [Candidatus Obscuribacterales bacterium]